MFAAAADATTVLSLVISHDSAEAATRRAAIRSTWGSFRQDGFSLTFVLGGRRPGSRAKLVGDVLRLPVSDRYAQLPLKVMDAMAWALEHEHGPGPEPRFFTHLLKADDDSFVCIANLLRTLRAAPRTRYYAGAPNGGTLHHEAPVRTRGRWSDAPYTRMHSRRRRRSVAERGMIG